MTVGEVFATISKHQVEGIMFHNDMADYYDFLGLCGFKRMHEYNYLLESIGMRGTHRYYINHYNKIVDDMSVDSKSYIPSVWREYTRKEVGSDARVSAIKSSMEKWVSWEKETKELYEKLYKELVTIGEIASSEKIAKMIKGVDKELKCADRLHIKLLSINYDMPTIVCMQDDLHKEYKEKSKKLGVSIC